MPKTHLGIRLFKINDILKEGNTAIIKYKLNLQIKLTIQSVYCSPRPDSYSIKTQADEVAEKLEREFAKNYLQQFDYFDNSCT